jgi:hypothetical protein
LAQKADTQTKIEYQNQDYISEDIIIKDNAIQAPSRFLPLEEDNGRTKLTVLSKSPIVWKDSGRNYSREEVQQLIRDYSAQAGISADLPLRIAQCESGFNQFSKNKTSTASGIFQYLSSTWAGTDQGKIGLSVFDAEANVKAAVSYIASRGHAQPWNASRSCWSK